MGWYTQGQGFEYKYGDVVSLALDSQLGRLTTTPRVGAMDEGGDQLEVEDLAFMGPLQRRVKELGLPWEPELEFSGPGDENLPVALDAKPRELLAEFVRHVQHNRLSIVQAIAKDYPREPAIVEIIVS